MKTEDIETMQKYFDNVMEMMDIIDTYDYKNHALTKVQLELFNKAYTALWDIRADLYGDAH